VYFRALRTARAESLLRSSKAAREDTPISCQHVFKQPKSSIFRTLSSCLPGPSVQEDVYFRALRTARAESLLRSSKAAREDTPKVASMSSNNPKAAFIAHSARAFLARRFRKTCSFERCGRHELNRYFDRQKPHERTHLKSPACLQTTQKQHLSHTQLVPSWPVGSGRRVLSSAADVTSLIATSIVKSRTRGHT
jgi:hypothetical protein